MSETLPVKTVALFATDANQKLLNELRARVSVIELPKVSAVKTDAFDAAIDPLAFDWLIFPDTFAADFFLEKLAGQGFDLHELDSVRVCAFGEAVSDRLRFLQVHADVIPQKLDTANIFSMLADYISGEADFEGLRVLVVREISAEIEIAELLRLHKASVTEIPLYKFESERVENPARLKTLLKGGAADEFVFTSPFDATALQYLFKEPLPELLKETLISAADEVTFQTLLEHGLRPLYYRK